MSTFSPRDLLRPLFEPRDVAVIGASRTPGKIGHTVVANLLRHGFPGRIVPVNPAGGAIEAVPSVRSMLDAFVDLLESVQALAGRYGACLQAIDINPVLITSTGFVAVDALMVTRVPDSADPKSPHCFNPGRNA